MLCPSHTFISPHLPLPLVSWIRWMQTYISVDFIPLEKQSPRYYHCHVLGYKFYTQKLEKKRRKKLRIFSRVFIYGFHTLSPSISLSTTYTHKYIYISMMILTIQQKIGHRVAICYRQGPWVYAFGFRLNIFF